MHYKTYTIKAAARLTGLSELVIRAWEKRYGAIIPDRKGNRRIYSETDIEKLVLLKKLTAGDYRIGNIANYTLDELKDIATLSDLKKGEIANAFKPGTAESYVNIVAECIAYIRNFDNKNLELVLSNCAVEYSRNIFIDNIIIPLISKIGEYWQMGILRIAHEHFASTIIRKIISTLLDGFKVDERSPKILISTPQGQYHEIGALIGGALASADGWNVIYMGPSLPMEEIVFTAQKTEPSVILLSMIYPSDDYRLLQELSKFETLECSSRLVFSGDSIGGYKKKIDQIGGTIVHNSLEFRDLLKRVRYSNSIENQNISTERMN